MFFHCIEIKKEPVRVANGMIMVVEFVVGRRSYPIQKRGKRKQTVRSLVQPYRGPNHPFQDLTSFESRRSPFTSLSRACCTNTN